MRYNIVQHEYTKQYTCFLSCINNINNYYRYILTFNYNLNNLLMKVSLLTHLKNKVNILVHKLTQKKRSAVSSGVIL